MSSVTDEKLLLNVNWELIRYSESIMAKTNYDICTQNYNHNRVSPVS